MTNENEWVNMVYWSGLPDVYVTDVQCLNGIIWRIQACSVPLVNVPEVRLLRADLADQLMKQRDQARAALQACRNLFAIMIRDHDDEETRESAKIMLAVCKKGLGE